MPSKKRHKLIGSSLDKSDRKKRRKKSINKNHINFSLVTSLRKILPQKRLITRIEAIADF